MSPEQLEYILNSILELEIDEDVQIKDVINSNYIDDLKEAIHCISSNIN